MMGNADGGMNDAPAACGLAADFDCDSDDSPHLAMNAEPNPYDHFDADSDADVTRRLNEVYATEDSSLDPVIAELQAQALPLEDWSDRREITAEVLARWDAARIAQAVALRRAPREW
jgi:hypothetical protein